MTSKNIAQYLSKKLEISKKIIYQKHCNKVLHRYIKNLQIQWPGSYYIVLVA